MPICTRTLPSVAALILALSLTAGPARAQAPESAPEFEEAFHRTSGWTGADGTYSYPLPGSGGTVWGFSDTFFGEVREGRRLSPFRFEHNSMVLQTGDRFDVLEAPVFHPPGGGKSWFWLWDGTSGGEILLGEFAGDADETGFGFRQVGLWTARFAVEGSRVKVTDYVKLPYFAQSDGRLVTFGPVVLETPSWLYLYGVRDQDGQRSCVLARAPRGSLAVAGTWRFFDGEGWSREIDEAAPLFNEAGMEASVYATASGEFVYVGGPMGSQITARVAPTPWGPWGEAFAIGIAPEHGGDVYAYNAKAHPEQPRDGRVLVSYNVNTTDLEKVTVDAEIYRPRFFWWRPERPGLLPEGAATGTVQFVFPP